MLFNSYEFILIFLPLTLLSFFAMRKLFGQGAAVWWLNIVSFAFYLTWDKANPWVLLTSIAVNFTLGRLILGADKKAAAKGWMWLGVALNLAALGFYKYSAFAVSVANQALGRSWPLPELHMPMGISFYTFTQIALLVDCWRKHDTRWRYPLRDYGFFVTFFPHLLAGPILYHKRIVPQLSRRNFGMPETVHFSIGALLFCFGLAKKTLVADSLSPHVGPLFSNAANLGFLDAWAAAFLYTFQLYFDFSGYSDMAVGIGLMLGIRLPFNFASPYKSRSIIDFWRRWHMSLSFFLRHYLYIPLGGNRKGPARRYINLMLTMLLGGLWHGAGWTFVLWGGLHGLYLTFNHLWRAYFPSLSKRKWYRMLSWVLTFIAVAVAWVAFRAESLEAALHIWHAMAGFSGVQKASVSREVWWMLLSCLLWVITMPNSQQVAVTRRPKRVITIFGAVVGVLGFLSLTHLSEFLYFQF